MNIADFEGTRPEFRPEEFFVGRLEGWAILQGPLGGVQRRATIKAEGTMISGVIHFDETWTFDDGKTDALQWQITPSSEDNYVGSEPTLDGEARGERAGCAYHWAYTRNVPGDDGSSTKLNFDDWFFQIDRAVAIVVGTAGRLGLPFASATLTYRKIEPTD